jgi:hypothetical protein
MEAMSSFADYQRHNPARPPDWRWQRACDLHARGRQPSTQSDDEPTLRAVEYLGVLGSTTCPERPTGRLSRTHPDLHVAHRLFEHSGERRGEVEARLLAGQSPDEIVEFFPLGAAAIDAFENCFFNVRDRLEASDWIIGSLIRRSLSRSFGPWSLSEFWKVLGYAGGPLVLDVVLAATTERNSQRRQYPDELLRRVHRLMDVLMSPPTPSSLGKLTSGLEAERRLPEHCQVDQSAGMSVDDVLNKAVEIATAGANASAKTYLQRPTLRSHSRLGKKVKSSATIEVA